MISPHRSDRARPTIRPRGRIRSSGALWHAGWILAIGSGLLTYCLGIPRGAALLSGLGAMMLLLVARVGSGTTLRQLLATGSIRVPMAILLLALGAALIPYFSHPAGTAAISEGLVYLLVCGLALVILGSPDTRRSPGLDTWFFALGLLATAAAIAAWSDTLGLSRLFWEWNRGASVPPVSQSSGLRLIPGIVWNVNYFSIVCAIGSIAWLVLARERTGRRRTLLLSASLGLSATVLAAFSRGVVAASAVTGLFLFWWFRQSRRRWVMVLAGMSTLAVFAYLSATEITGVARLFQARGLNNRDVLWQAAYRAIADNPLDLLFGVGHANAGQALLDHDAGKSTTQSYYVYLLLTGGITGLVVRLTLLITPALMTLRRLGRLRGDPPLGGALGLLLLVSLDGLFRTYSLGGLGFAPLAMTTAWAASIGLASAHPGYDR